MKSRFWLILVFSAVHKENVSHPPTILTGPYARMSESGDSVGAILLMARVKDDIPSEITFSTDF